MARQLARRISSPWRLRPLEVAALALALPLAVPVIAVAVSAAAGTGTVFNHIAETMLADYVVNTSVLAALVVFGVLIVGAPAAWFTAMCEFPGRRFFEAALVLPLAAPAYVLAYAYTDLLDAYGPVQGMMRAMFGWDAGDYWFPNVRSLPGAALMLTLVLYPYVYLLARARFLAESATALEAARMLGRNTWRAFLEVSLPLARPALAAGAALALMETLADYGTVSYFSVPVFTTGIYRAWFSFGDPDAAARLSAILIGIVALALLLERLARGGARYHESGRRDRRPERFRLTPARSAAAIIACSLPPLFGFAVPAIVLLDLIFTEGLPGRGFLSHALNSVTVAGLAGVLAALAALILAYARRERPEGPAAKAASFAGLGYAVPGAVIAVGVLIPFATLDNAVDAFTRETFGVSTGLIITGSIAALVFAYIVRFLAVALHGISAGLERITPSIGGAARLLSRGAFDSLIRVHAPLVLPSTLTAALIVFVDVMKELPATLMLRPFNFDTLAVAAHHYAADERLGLAAAPALAIVLAGVLPCVLLIRGIAASSEGRRHESYIAAIP